MATIALMPSDGEGPRKPRGIVPALASGYVAGYAAALGAGVTVVGSGGVVTAVVILVQAVGAAVCWIATRRRRS
ncbi:hypothetical protein [Streptomyces olivochromogenes]|uniref:hypothetical protein n=1 Tax=Streptomyces olivochromogenes TaxID=1963 RepID=UPI0036A6B095